MASSDNGQTARPVLWNSNYLKVWIANFMLFFAFYLLAPLLPLYLRDTFAANKAMIGFVLCGYTLTALCVRPFSGFVVDTFNRKKVLLLCYFCFALLFAGYYVTGSLLFFAVIRTLHGAPFGATTVASSTMAIDVLHPERRSEGIGYYGLSNNIAMAIGPSAGLYIYHTIHNFNLLFTLSLLIAFAGLAIDSTIHCRDRQPVQRDRKLSLDRFVLLKGWSEGLCIAAFAFSFGVISTYIAIYSQEVLHVTSGSGTFFMLLAVGLILSRLIGSKSLRQGKIVQNASAGMVLSLCGYLVFSAVPNLWGYYAAALMIGLGNGHMYPAMQTMFINLAPHERRGTANSTILTSWDLGVGIGIIGGGSVAEHLGSYAAAFWLAFAVNAAGVIFYFLYARRSFLANRLRDPAPRVGARKNGRPSMRNSLPFVCRREVLRSIRTCTGPRSHHLLVGVADRLVQDRHEGLREPELPDQPLQRRLMRSNSFSVERPLDVEILELQQLGIFAVGGETRRHALELVALARAGSRGPAETARSTSAPLSSISSRTERSTTGSRQTTPPPSWLPPSSPSPARLDMQVVARDSRTACRCGAMKALM